MVRTATLRQTAPRVSSIQQRLERQRQTREIKKIEGQRAEELRKKLELEAKQKAEYLEQKAEYDKQKAEYLEQKAKYESQQRVKEAYSYGVGKYGLGSIVGSARTKYNLSNQEWADYKSLVTGRKKLHDFNVQLRSVPPGTLPAVSSAVRVEQARNTYDPSTGVYINKSGQGMSIDKAPKGATIVGQPTFDFTTPTNIKDILEQRTKFQETKRYQDLGYSKSDASKLARESLARGGFTFTKEGAREITRPDIVTKARDVKTYITEKAKDTISYFKDDKVKTKEIYSPSVSGFVTASAMGQGTNIFLRGTTEEERKKIQSAKDRGSFKLNVEETKRIKELDTKVKEYEKDYKELTAYEIPKFEKDNSINGKFDFNNLSTSKQKEYNSLIKEAETTYDKYISLYEKRGKYVEDTSVTFKSKNIFGKTTYEKKVPVTELTTPFGYVTQKYKTMTEAAGEGVGKLYEKIPRISKSPFISTGMFIRGEISGKEFVSGFKETKPDVIYDLTTGEARVPTEKDLTKDKSSPFLYVQPEQVSKVTATTLEFGAYAMPYVGAGLVVSHIGETTGKYDYSPSKFWKESTTGEKVGVGLGLAYLGVPPLYRGAKKVDKYFTEPIRVDIPRGYKIIKRGDELFGKTLEIGKADELSSWRWKAEIKPSERYLKKVTQKTIQKPETTFIEVAQQEGEIMKSYPMIFESPSLIKETTLISKKGKKLFDTKLDKRVEFKYTQPKITEPFAQVPVVADKSFTLRSAKLTKEGKLGEPKYVSVMAEEAKYVPVKDISKLDKVSEYTLLETLKKGKGREIPYIKETEQAQIGLRQELVITKPIGKKTALKRTTAIVEELPSVGDTRLFDITAGTKDVSKAFSRATGRIDTITGKYILLPPIEKGAKEIGKTYIGGKKTLLSSTFKLEEVQALKYIPKEPPKPTIKTIAKIEAEAIPSMVGGTGLKDIKYAGTGLYEQVEVSTTTPTSLSSITSYAMLDTQRDVSVPITTLDVRTDTKTISRLKPLVSLDSKPEVKTITIPITRTITRERLKQPQKSKQAPRLVSLLKTAQVQRPIQRELLRQPTKTIQPTRPKPKEPIKPKTPLIKLPKPSLAKRLAKKAEQGMFEAVGFRFGKEVLLGEAKTQTAAEKKLSSFLKKTLGASGYISKDEVKLKVSKLKTFGTGEFRVGKTSPFLVVEKKSKRLRKFTTGKQIQFFR